ncbi:MAG: hypothetical protein ACYDCK_07575 [Thermoplasmatota archaeon]
MPGASALLASLFLTVGLASLTAALVRLAQRAHRADDLGDVPVPWGLLAVGGGAEAIAAALRVYRYITESSTSAIEIELQVACGALAAFLLVGFLRAVHRARANEAPEGTLVAGLVLVGTALLSTFFITDTGNTAVIQFALALELGAWAWALSDLAYETRSLGSPRWASTLAQIGAYVLVIGAYARAIASNGSDFLAVVQATRLTLAMTYFIGAAFALPALTMLAVSIEPVKRELDELRATSGETSSSP